MRYITGIALSLTLLSCKTTYQFIDVSNELNSVLEGQKEIKDLDFGYQMVTYLDTGFYQIIFQLENFDTEINPREELKLIVDLPYDSLELGNEYSSIQDVISKSKLFHKTINPEKLDFDYSIPVAGNRAMSWVGDDCYVFELLEPDVVGTFVITTRFSDGFPKSFIKKWERKKRRANRKKEN